MIYVCDSSKKKFQVYISFVFIAELHNTLPKMVVDILEEKLEREYSDSTAQLLKRFNGYEDSKDDIESEVDERDKTMEGDSLDLPKHWLSMDNSKVTEKIPIQCLHYIYS